MATRKKHNTREAWLVAAVGALETELFKPLKYTMPRKWRVSVGWPLGKRSAIGQCWDTQCSADGTAEMFISPKLDQRSRVLDVLAHEMVHAIIGCEHGHRAPFKHLATAIGLAGKMTATIASPELQKRLDKIGKRLGQYPHKEIMPGENRKPQGTRLIKCACPECGYTVRVTRMWLAVGAPICPACEIHMQQCGIFA